MSTSAEAEGAEKQELWALAESEGGLQGGHSFKQGLERWVGSGSLEVQPEARAKQQFSGGRKSPGQGRGGK